MPETSPGTGFFSCDSGGVRLLLLGDCLLGHAQVLAGLSAALRAGRPERVAEWPGAYTAIIIRAGLLTAYTDPAGQFPLYYSKCGGELLVGPDPAAIAVAHRRIPDPLSAAAHITCPGVLPLWWGRSAYDGIGRVEGGATLQVAAGRLRIDQDRLPLPVPGTTLDGGATVLKDALTAAVRARCETGEVISADFSGGLDSSSVAFLAASAAGASRETPLRAVTYHQPLAPAADLEDALRLAALSPAIDLTVTRGAEDTLPFGCLADMMPRPVMGAEPAPQVLAVRRDTIRLAAVAATGARLHLTGEGGDAILMAAPSSLAGLARKRALGALWQRSGEYARLRHVAPASLATRAIRLAGTSPQSALRATAAALTRAAPGSPAGWADLISWWPSPQASDWLKPGIRRQLADLATELAADRSTGPGMVPAVSARIGPADLSALADLRRSGAASRHLRALGRDYGLAVHAPLLDTSVVRAALSVPAETRADPASYKPLLTTALTGLVPPAVLARRTKGDYSAEYYLGARRAAAALRGLLADSRLADLGVIEPAQVRSALDLMTAGIAVPLGPFTTLIATELWLRTTPGPAL